MSRPWHSKYQLRPSAFPHLFSLLGVPCSSEGYSAFTDNPIKCYSRHGYVVLLCQSLHLGEKGVHLLPGQASPESEYLSCGSPWHRCRLTFGLLEVDERHCTFQSDDPLPTGSLKMSIVASQLDSSIDLQPRQVTFRFFISSSNPLFSGNCRRMLYSTWLTASGILSRARMSYI